MKKIILFLLPLIFFAACKKDSSSATNSDDQNLLTHKITYSYKDTVTSHLDTGKLQLHSTLPATLKLNYAGNNRYTFTVYFKSGLAASFAVYRNGVLYDSDPNSINPFTLVLTTGTYYCTVTYQDQNSNWVSSQTQSFTIVAEPVAPSGMLCLYEYYNPVNGQHICTYDWEELGSTSHDWIFIKVMGYTYPSAASAANLKPIYRYYNASTGSHYTTDLLGSYPGFVYEKILGYVGTSATSDLSRSLTRYYNHILDDHFVCVAPEVPIASDYVPDPVFVFGYVK